MIWENAREFGSCESPLAVSLGSRETWPPQLEPGSLPPAVLCWANAGAPAVGWWSISPMGYRARFPACIQSARNNVFRISGFYKNKNNICELNTHITKNNNNNKNKHTHHQLHVPWNDFLPCFLTSHKTLTRPGKSRARCPWSWLLEAWGSLLATQGSSPAGRAPGTESDTSPWKCPSGTAGCHHTLPARPKRRVPACLSRRLTSITHPSQHTRTVWQSQPGLVCAKWNWKLNLLTPSFSVPSWLLALVAAAPGSLGQATGQAQGSPGVKTQIGLRSSQIWRRGSDSSTCTRKPWFGVEGWALVPAPGMPLSGDGGRS